MKRTTFERFDLVSISTTQGVKWMVDLPGKLTKPEGIWSIICTLPKSGRLLLQKGTALILIPASDVRKVANYEVGQIFDKLDDSNTYLNNLEKQDERNVQRPGSTTQKPQ
jgi:hypothetical protein